MAVKDLAPAPERVVVDLAGLRAMGVNFSNQHLLSLEKTGRWPRRLSLGGRFVVWLRSEVLATIEARAAEREASAAERSAAALAGAGTRKAKTAATDPLK